ncbi:hypothetical protein ES703_116068 [subsurface metagenome]
MKVDSASRICYTYLWNFVLLTTFLRGLTDSIVPVINNNPNGGLYEGRVRLRRRGENMLLLALGLGLGLGFIGGIALVWHSRNYDITLDRKITDKLEELPPLFERAETAVEVATDFDSRFFDEPRVKDAIEKALANGARVRFLTDGEVPPWYGTKAKIEIKHIKKLLRHTMMIDSRHARLERPHPPGTFGNRFFDIALIFKDFPQLARKLGKDFDQLWTSPS